MNRHKLPLLLLTLLSLFLTSCGAVRQAWGEAYRHQGGYYATHSGKPSVQPQ